ncbi:TAF10 [Hepatospora eriocheir]|uniref:TAF10 n=1 Tax=Hepatospora eriocheir TaxID=1081669 RepID=A0A1X0Q9S8_9MICR|nr:TAF10 [Hepatospora eriocheir]
MNNKETEEIRNKLKDYKPLLPDTIMNYFLEKNGVKTNNKEVKNLINAMSHKFLTDVAVNAKQFNKIRRKASGKDIRFLTEKKTTLTIEDLEKALKEMGINVSRPHYFS